MTVWTLVILMYAANGGASVAIPISGNQEQCHAEARRLIAAPEIGWDKSRIVRIFCVNR